MVSREIENLSSFVDVHCTLTGCMLHGFPLHVMLIHEQSDRVKFTVTNTSKSNCKFLSSYNTLLCISIYLIFGHDHAGREPWISSEMSYLIFDMCLRIELHTCKCNNICKTWFLQNIWFSWHIAKPQGSHNNFCLPSCPFLRPLWSSSSHLNLYESLQSWFTTQISSQTTKNIRCWFL